MLRRYTHADYIARISRLKSRVPGLTLSSDIIVGFPGETEEDFLQTLELVREAGFVSVFGFKYSPRPHTPALRLEDDVSEDDKDDRLQRLFALVAEQQTAHLASLVGTQQTVLVESKDDSRPHHYTGRSERNELVHLDAPEGHDPIGLLVDVEIIEAFKHSLHGVMHGVPPVRDIPKPKKAPLRLPLAAPTDCDA
jgi:tRNA-2-methylthio-N6-dimethylallyladenosine synthase